MPDFGINPFDAAFFLVQVIAAWWGLRIRGFSALLVLTSAVALLGWGCLLGAEMWFDSRLATFVDALPQPLNNEQTTLFNTDGASKGFVFLFGFPIAWATAALAVGLARMLRQAWRSHTHSSTTR